MQRKDMFTKSSAYDMSRFKKETNKRADPLGEALKEHFGKPLYWVKYKFGVARTDRVFNEMVKLGDKNFTHFMQRLNHD